MQGVARMLQGSKCRKNTSAAYVLGMQQLEVLQWYCTGVPSIDICKQQLRWKSKQHMVAPIDTKSAVDYFQKKFILRTIQSKRFMKSWGRHEEEYVFSCLFSILEDLRILVRLLLLLWHLHCREKSARIGQDLACLILPNGEIQDRIPLLLDVSWSPASKLPG